MDELKKYNSFLIPRRDTPEPGGIAPYGKSAPSDEAPLSRTTNFAEIEIDFGSSHESASDRALRFFSSVSPPEPIEQKAHDPLRLKFYEMRRLASGRPFARDDSELFYKQAKFMEDFADSFPADAKFFMYYPYYQHMGYDQLRTYFTWRTRFRSGEITPTSVSYVFLYVYELLNNIGVGDPSEGLDKLLSVWQNCLKFCPALENYMPQWFKDYHIYYGMSDSYVDFADEHGLFGYYSAAFLFDSDIEKSFRAFAGISPYDTAKSRFLGEGNEQLFKDCFGAVLDGIRRLCENNGFSIEELFIYSAGRKMPWQPFKQALFHHHRGQEDCMVEMPGGERYFCRNNRWSSSLPIYYSTQKEFVGYIVKKTEACLRQAVKYKYKLTAEPTARYGSPFGELKRFGYRSAELEKTIEKAVADFHRELTRTVVSVDQTNLVRIREEAQGTQERLIVPDDEREQGSGVRGQETGDALRNAELVVLSKTDAKPSENAECRMQNAELGATPQTDDGWDALKEALDAVELVALEMVLRGDSGIKAFADENGVMLEVLADGINEKAADLIGDSILDAGDGIAVFDEYRDDLARLLHMV